MRVNSNQTREALLQQFVDWCAANITGDEKGQAQIFLDRLFQAFGQRGSLDVGGTAEMRIRGFAQRDDFQLLLVQNDLPLCRVKLGNAVDVCASRDL